MLPWAKMTWRWNVCVNAKIPINNNNSKSRDSKKILRRGIMIPERIQRTEKTVNNLLHYYILILRSWTWQVLAFKFECNVFWHPKNPHLFLRPSLTKLPVNFTNFIILGPTNFQRIYFQSPPKSLPNLLWRLVSLHLPPKPIFIHLSPSIPTTL